MSSDNLIRTKVENFVKNEKMFTSVDIANAIKGDGDWVRNIEVASWLRENFHKEDMFLEYKTTPITVCSGSRSATLYIPEWEDSDKYANRDQNPLTPKDVESIKKKKVSKQSAPDIVDLLNKPQALMSKVIKSKERIKIPGEMIRKMGYTPGDKVPPDVVKAHNNIPGRLIVNKDYRFSIPRSSVNWGTAPVKVILTKDNKITFEKA